MHSLIVFLLLTTNELSMKSVKIVIYFDMHFCAYASVTVFSFIILCETNILETINV